MLLVLEVILEARLEEFQHLLHRVVLLQFNQVIQLSQILTEDLLLLLLTQLLALITIIQEYGFLVVHMKILELIQDMSKHIQGDQVL